MIAGIVLLTLLLGGGYILRQDHHAEADQLVAEGRTLHEDERWSQAGACYDAALRLVPDFYKAVGFKAYLLKDEYFKKGYSYRDPGLLLESLSWCDRGLKQKPDSTGLWNLRSVLLYSLGRLPEAEAAARTTLTLNPDYFHAASNLAKILALQHRFDEALEVLADAVHAAPTEKSEKYDDGIWRTLGTLQLFLGDHQQALASLEAARTVHPRDTQNWLLLARLHLERDGPGDRREALALAQHAGAFTTLVDPRFGRVLATALLANGQNEDAARHARAALQGGDLAVVCHLLITIAEARLGRHAEAREHLRQAEQEWPESMDQDKVLVTSEKGLLWFDTLEELEVLHRQALEALSPELSESEKTP